MASLYHIPRIGGTFRIAGSGSNDISNLPQTGDYITVDSEVFIYSRNVTDIPRGYVYVGASHSESINNMVTAINLANHLYYTRGPEQERWNKGDAAFARDMHFCGNGIGSYTGEHTLASTSGSISGSSLVIPAFKDF